MKSRSNYMKLLIKWIIQGNTKQQLKLKTDVKLNKSVFNNFFIFSISWWNKISHLKINITKRMLLCTVVFLRMDPFKKSDLLLKWL